MTGVLINRGIWTQTCKQGDGPVKPAVMLPQAQELPEASTGAWHLQREQGPANTLIPDL